jgi:hypothetical protein
MQPERYLVFARSAYAEPLGFQGTLEVAAGQDPQRQALEIYGAEWVELALVPEREVFWAIEEPVATDVEAQL